MICSRCGLLLVEDRFMEWTARWRCLKCGHVHDSASVESYLATQTQHLYANTNSGASPHPTISKSLEWDTRQDRHKMTSGGTRKRNPMNSKCSA